MAYAKNRRSDDPAGVRAAARITLLVLGSGLLYFLVVFLAAR